MKKVLYTLIIVAFCALFFNVREIYGKPETVNCSYWNTQSDTISKFAHYRQLLHSGIHHFVDSIDNPREKIMIALRVKEFDTTACRLHLNMDFTWYMAVYPDFYPTHFLLINGRMVFIRFSENVSDVIIRSLGFNVVTEKIISEYMEDLKIFIAKNGSITGFTKSYTIEVRNDSIFTRWYNPSEYAPLLDQIGEINAKDSILFEKYYKKFYGSRRKE